MESARSLRNRRLIALAAVAMLLVAGVAWMTLRPRTIEAPTFRLQAIDAETGLPSNVTLDLSAARGKVVVLDFMAVNCASCRTMTKQVLTPLWESEAANGTASGFVLWSIDVWASQPGQVGETGEDLAAVQRKEGSEWPHALDDGSVFAAYRPQALPHLLVIDAAGRITYQHGAPDLPSLDQVRHAIAEARTGTASPVGIPRGGLAGLALVAGAAAVFSPCSVGLLPAYFGMLLRGRGAARPVVGGLMATAGVVLAYGAIALLLLPFGNNLLPLVPRLGIAMGILFILLGATMLAGFDWGRLTRRLPHHRLAPDGSRRGYGLFGIGYALASFGCTGPIFLPLLFSAFAQGAAVGLGIFLLYAAGIAVLLVLIAVLASLGAEGPLRRLLAHSPWIARVVAVLWIFAGAYLVWYDIAAFS